MSTRPPDEPLLQRDGLAERDLRGQRLPDLPVERARTPGFATIGRPPPREGLWSKPLMLLVALTIFASFVALMADLQARKPLRAVEVTFMEEEAAAAAAELEAVAPAPAADGPSDAPGDSADR